MNVARRFLAAAAALLVVGCSGDAPQVPTTLLASSVASNISALAGTTATDIPTVTLNDATGRGIAGVWVHFTAIGGGKPVNDSSRTNASGLASSGGWILGTMAGTQTLIASAANLPSVTFTAQVGAGAVATLVRITPDPQSGVVNTAALNPPSVRALDQYGNPVAGVVVTFSTVNGAGTIVGAQKTTDANGVATADGWTLGTVAGQQLARATAAGVSLPATFSVNAVAAAPAKIAVVAGNDGNGVAGASLASFSTLPTVRITDAFDNPVAGVTVVFTPGPNSGTVTGGSVVTNEFGLATVVGWILGTAPIETLIATSPSIPGLQVVFTVTAQASQFNITVRYIGDLPSARQQLAVTRAVEKWRSVIISNSGTS
ncbi:MAG: Ig-like domain-containing protein, partial [Gemmatimonadota bacterium]|nr:Ig-like domain-containing protein [Gemmatimonadota bacterium]